MILRTNILTTATLRDKYREYKLLSQLHKFLNTCYLNITSENKFTTIVKILVLTLPTEPTRLNIIYYYIYPSTYDARVQMILPEYVSWHIWDDNNDHVR